MIYIDEVHYVQSSYGYEYISEVRWTDNLNSKAYKSCSKHDMINFINQHPNSVKTKYYRYGNWYVGEDVRVVDNSYLRTDANNIKADNLGNLPRY